jgi:hypothetical protein
MIQNTDTQGYMPAAGKCHWFNILLPSRLYCRYRSLTGSILFTGVADCTADREFHPALKKAKFMVAHTQSPVQMYTYFEYEVQEF